MNSDQRDKPEIAVMPEASDECCHVDARVGLVDGFDVDGYVWSKDLPLRAVRRNCVYGSERIGRNYRAPPADYVPVVAVM